MLTPRAAQDQTHAHVAFAISAGTSTLQLRKGAGVIAQDSKAREELGKTKDCGEDCKLKPGKTEEQQFGSSLRLRWQGAGPRLYLFSVVRKLNRNEPSLHVPSVGGERYAGRRSGFEGGTRLQFPRCREISSLFVVQADA